VSRSLGLSPLLLDSRGLIFEFPQRAVAPGTTHVVLGAPPARSSLWVAATEFYLQKNNLGALWRRRSIGLFALSQPSYLSHVRPPAYVDIYAQPNTDQVLQSGVGAQWRMLRAGFAFRATRNREDSGSGYTTGSGTDDHLSGSQNELDYHELSLGVGFEARGIEADVAVEWQDESYEEAQASVSGPNAQVIQAVGDARGWSGLVARLAVPAGRKVCIVAAGQAHCSDRTWTGIRIDPSSLQRFTFGERTKSWGASLGVVLDTGVPERLVLAASYAYRDEPISGVTGSYLQWTRSQDSQGLLTAAVQQTLWRGLLVRAGFSLTYSETKTSSRYLVAPDDNWRHQTTETLGDMFSWGFSYAWRNVQFEGALRTPPQVSTPITVFDLYITF